MRPPQRLSVAVVSRDPDVRSSAARAFDDAPVSWSIRLASDLPVAADVVVFGADCAPSDGIVFDPANPRVVIEQVAAAADGSRLIVVSSPSGGTGATSVALHLAAALAVRHTVCFVDLCTGSGASGRLGMADEGSRTWADAGESEQSLMLAAHPVRGGFRALLAPCEEEATVDARALLERTGAAFDRVVVEARNTAALADVLGRAASAVMVVAPSPPGAHRAKMMCARHPSVPWAIVANRLGPGGETTRAGIERVLGHRIALELPCCPAFRDAEDHGELLTARWTRWGRRVERLARGLEHR